MGERALKDLGLPNHASTLWVVHRCPAPVRHFGVADGVQAATGASPGKLSLCVEEATAEAMRTVIRDQKSGRALTLSLKPEFVRLVADLPHDRLEAEGRRVAALPDDVVFQVVESK
jgi:hypothetical protein